MIGASIYGFVDYKQTHKKKEFKEMYSEKKAADPVIVVTPEEPAPVPDRIADTKTKPIAPKKKVAASEIAVDPIQPVAEEDKMAREKKNIASEPAVSVEPSEESSALKTVKKKRKIRKEFFSRAPLRDEEEVLIDPVKKEKKTATREL
jgi:hypothetical protein